MDSEGLQDVVEPTQEPDDVIQPINRDTVHRICSGQVVLSLAIAVKELVENAIDAGATNIDIRLKEYGSDLIEVSDNGKGVLRDNFQALTLKHYTSKIRKFSDLESICTLGFRGEALSSLCALSDLTVLTKHANSEHATKITYDRNGKITNEATGAREQGTTVTLENLFSTLPVRRKEFEKNLKREFNKMCHLLYAYCLVSKGIKFSCTNTLKKGSKNAVVATEGSMSVRENIISVFGPKQISTLIEVENIRPEEEHCSEYGIKLVEGAELPFNVEFLVSSVMHGSGRSTSDRQFYYVNSRPCEPTKIMRLVNEVYRQYNGGQYPFVYLNITSKSSLVDVNVTPDKRQVFLEKEKVLLATLKASLVEAFKAFPSTFKMQNLELSQSSTIMSSFINREGRGLKRNNTDENQTSGGIKKGSITERFMKRSKTENDKFTQRTIEDTLALEAEVDRKLNRFIETAKKLVEDDSDEQVTRFGDTPNKFQSLRERTELRNIDPHEEINVPVLSLKESTCKNNEVRLNTVASDIIEIKDEPISAKDIVEEPTVITLDSPSRQPHNRRSVVLHTSIDDICASLDRSTDQQNGDRNNLKVRFRSTIDPESNKTAEEELKRQISKEDFKKMSIIGQFNLGFIVARLENDLFIIDQHATDEKYNFEQLQATTVMENQVLVVPRPLQLTAGDESLLIENEDIFKKNGFTFKIDQTAPCTKKISLIAVPLSKSVVFGKDDIDEMLFMLRDSNQTMCRPSRVRGLFASRACRKSVMIGKALSNSDMRRLIDHMGEIEQPWNCPHGRPTMRHLLNLDLLHIE